MENYRKKCPFFSGETTVFPLSVQPKKGNSAFCITRDPYIQKKKGAVMYNIGDTVMYPGTGVCRIENIVRESFVRGEERTYYVLKAVYESGGTTIYCPVDSENVRLRGLLSREAIDRILSDACAHESLWVENALQRKKAFLSILKEDNGVRLLRMLIDLHEHRKKQASEGKKMHVSDEKIMTEAEKMWNQELASALKMELASVPEFVVSQLNLNKNAAESVGYGG